MTELENMVMELSNAFGPSGFEGDVRGIFEKNLRDRTEISYDNIGSIIARHQGSTATPKIMLAAHMDEVGLMVRGVLPGGYLKIVPLGGWWAPSLNAQRVLIRSKNGLHFGVIGAKPPHYMKEADRKRQLEIGDLYIDVGATSAEAVTVMGISPGDPVVPAVRAELLGETETILGKGLDDRAGCAALIRVLQELDSSHPNLVVGAGTVQEENGTKGARTVAPLVEPDLCLVLEGTPADDFPDAGLIQGRLGGGPQIRRFDPSMIASPALADLAIQVAREAGIPYQVAVREGGGTDGSVLQLQASGGAPTAVIGVPVRYAHSHQGIISLKDLSATVALVKALLYRLDGATVTRLKQQPWG